MQDPTRIPYRNLYYMLCYAWNRLKEKEFIHIGQEEDRDIYNLLVRVLVTQLQGLVRRGLYREYTSIEEETASLKGKLNFQESVRKLSFHRGSMVISHEELSHDSLLNRIIKATLVQLLLVDGLDQALKDKIYPVTAYFEQVAHVTLNPRMFHEVKLHRNNRHYGIVIDICKLFYDSLLLNEENSKLRFRDFERNHQDMAMLFENFVRNFYASECPHYKVYREHIHWEALGDEVNLLPRMETDISIDGNSFKIIMDTKFYHSALSQKGDSEKLISGNLYQMFAYLENHRDIKKPISGILLYPKVHKDLNLDYVIKGHQLKVVTVDLTRSWRSIHQRLIDIIKL